MGKSRDHFDHTTSGTIAYGVRLSTGPQLFHVGVQT